MKKMKVDILGTEYSVFLDVPAEEMPPNADGIMDYSIKAIKVIEMKPEQGSIENLDVYKKKVLRHEIIHAFLRESGLWENSGETEAWGCDETITDWIAIQAPKLYRAFEATGCI